MHFLQSTSLSEINYSSLGNIRVLYKREVVLSLVGNTYAPPASHARHAFGRPRVLTLDIP